MSSSWTFGRIGLATSAGGDGLELPPHLPPQWDGDELTLVCDLPAATVPDQVVLRDQFNGYDLNPDEPVVPITSVNVPSLDGFYRVQEVNVDDRVGTFIEGGEGSLVTVVARKVPAFTAPLFEVICTGTDRINAHGLTGNGWAGWPGSATDASVLYDDSSSLVGGGSVAVVIGDSAYSDSYEFGMAPGSAYEGAVSLFVDDAVVVGRQANRAPTSWSIVNGLVEIKSSPTEANHFIVGVRNSGATDYDEKAYRVGYYNGEPMELNYNGTTRTAPVGPIVLRNSPECVAVRFIYGGTAYQFDGGGSDGAQPTRTLDITVRRGGFYGEFVLSTTTAGNLGVWRATTDAGTSITGGIEDNAADGAGNKWRIYTPQTRTADTTNGGLYVNTASLRFGIGNDRAIYADPNLGIDDAYFAAMNHRQRIVSR